MQDGRRIANMFGPGGIVQIFDVNGKARRLALGFARSRFDPGHFAAVRRNRDFAKFVQSG